MKRANRFFLFFVFLFSGGITFSINALPGRIATDLLHFSKEGGGASLAATMAIEAGLAATEAGVVYLVEKDPNKAIMTFATGIVSGAIGEGIGRIARRAMSKEVTEDILESGADLATKTTLKQARIAAKIANPTSEMILKAEHGFVKLSDLSEYAKKTFNFSKDQLSKLGDDLMELSAKGEQSILLGCVNPISAFGDRGDGDNSRGERKCMLSAYKMLREKFPNIPIKDLPLTKLGDDFNANPLLESFLKKNPNGLKAWEEALTRNLPTSWRTDPDFLKPFAKALDEKPKIDLHLTGHINGSGNAVGCHLSSAVDNINVRIRPTQPPGFPTYYPNGKLKEAAIDIKSGNSWVPKTNKSTFFPDTWTNDKVLNEIAFVRSKPGNKITDRIWKGKASDGVTDIQVEYTGPLDNLTFSTAYPVVN